MRTVYHYNPNTRTFSSSSSFTENTVPFGIVNMVNRSEIDGSYLEKPMSKSYIEHIRSRNSSSIKRMKPNMGSYGA